MDSFQRRTYQKAWMIGAIILTCDLIIKYNLKIPERKHCLITYRSWYLFLNKQPLSIFKIARKYWWKNFYGIEIGIIKAYTKVTFSKFNRERDQNFWDTPFMTTHLCGFLLLSSTLFSSVPSLKIGLHLWFFFSTYGFNLTK